MQHLTTAEIQARLVEWQRTANDINAPAHLRTTARRAVRLHTAELKSRES